MTPPAQATACARCRTDLAPGMLSCPSCSKLVHADQLQRLAWEAEAAQRSGDPARARSLWSEALPLIPLGTRQHETVAARIFELEQGVSKAPAEVSSGNAGKGVVAGLGAVGLVLLKFKTVLLLLLGKAKFLLFGLSKMGTLLSMFLSFGYYWTRYGWAFGAGLVLSIYVHEMGHVWKLRSYGVPATAPMFIPGFGALIRSQRAGTVAQEARIGLWGPLWGLAAPIAAGIIFLLTGSPIWAAISRWGAIINLFNLTPFWQLDGGHAFTALSRRQRGIAALVILGTFFLTGEHTLLILLLAAGWQLFREAPENGDRNALQIYAALVVAFSAFALLIPHAVGR
jgi:Zn-dependent protease